MEKFDDQTVWRAWQLVDSAFPSGCFAHSGGLEAAANWKEIRDVDELADFVRASLVTAGRSQLPFVLAAHERTAPFDELDRQCDALLSNHVANRSSRNQGRALLGSASAAFRRPDLEVLRREVREQQLPGHQAPIFGVVAFSLDISRLETARLFLFSALRGLISSAVRLNLVGPLLGQRIQFRMNELAEEVVRNCVSVCVEEPAHTAPVIDILQSTHDRVYSKLFQS